MKALYISIRCKQFSIGRILIDDGSALNIMPYATLKKLTIDASYIRSNPMMVKAFDGTKRAIIGDIEVTLKIGPVDFEMTFQVGEEAMEDAFQSFEVAEVLHLKEGTTLPQFHVTKNLMMQLKQLVEKGWKAGYGLGKRLQGIKKPLTAQKHDSTFGLGYKPSKKDRAKDIEKKKMKRLARLEGKAVEGGKMEFPPLFHTFRFVGWTNTDSLGARNGTESTCDELQGLSMHAVGDKIDVGYPWIYPANLGPNDQN